MKLPSNEPPSCGLLGTRRPSNHFGHVFQLPCLAYFRNTLSGPKEDQIKLACETFFNKLLPISRTAPKIELPSSHLTSSLNHSIVALVRVTQPVISSLMRNVLFACGRLTMAAGAASSLTRAIFAQIHNTYTVLQFY